MEIRTATVKCEFWDVEDVTASGAKGLMVWFVPGWCDMIKALREGRIDREEYTRRYLAKLDAVPDDVCVKAWGRREAVTLCCFCKPGEFCHRVLLARWLEKHGFGTYIGERGVDGC